MCDTNLRRALMVSKGSFLPVFTRPVALILFLVIAYMMISQIPAVKAVQNRVVAALFSRRKKAGKSQE
jgi:putative tricarboxylic transport membrane protein